MKLTEWEKNNFASSTLDKGFIFRIYKGLKKKTSEEKGIQVKCGLWL